MGNIGRMSYKKHKPISVEKMLKDRYEKHHTICQKLREIYQLTDNPLIKYKCRMAISMAKSMNDKLKKYRKQFDGMSISS